MLHQTAPLSLQKLQLQQRRLQNSAPKSTLRFDISWKIGQGGPPSFSGRAVQATRAVDSRLALGFDAGAERFHRKEQCSYADVAEDLADHRRMRAELKRKLTQRSEGSVQVHTEGGVATTRKVTEETFGAEQRRQARAQKAPIASGSVVPKLVFNEYREYPAKSVSNADYDKPELDTGAREIARGAYQRNYTLDKETHVPIGTKYWGESKCEGRREQAAPEAVPGTDRAAIAAHIRSRKADMQRTHFQYGAEEMDYITDARYANRVGEEQMRNPTRPAELIATDPRKAQHTVNIDLVYDTDYL